MTALALLAHSANSFSGTESATMPAPAWMCPRSPSMNRVRMAMQESSTGHKVSLDQVIRTMYQSGLDMQSRYKETALAGLAGNV